MATTSHNDADLAKEGVCPPSRIFACLNVFEEGRTIERCLKSLVGKVEKIIVIDGAYKEFPHEKPYSTDGTIETARQYADVIVTANEPWENEIVKRNFYLRFVPVGTYWLRIDGDETLEGEFPKDMTEDAYMMLLYRTDKVGPYPIHAVFKRTEHSYYYGTNHAVHNGNKLLVKENATILGRAALRHHIQDSRSDERIARKGEYYKWLNQAESGFRSANRL